MSDTSILAYCRPGYENDTANELTSRYGEAGFYGYPVSKKNSGFAHYYLYDAAQLEQTVTQFAVHDSIFPRQLVAVFAAINDVEKEDRVGQVLDALQEVEKPFSIFGAVDVEYPDTEEGKTLAKFCRKFTVPLRQALRKAGWLTAKENLGKPKLHIFFASFEICYIG